MILPRHMGAFFLVAIRFLSNYTSLKLVSMKVSKNIWLFRVIGFRSIFGY